MALCNSKSLKQSAFDKVFHVHRMSLYNTMITVYKKYIYYVES